MVITICACAQYTRQARTEAWPRLASVSSEELPFYQRGWWAHSIILREGERGRKGGREGEGEGGKYFMGEEWDSRSTKYKGLFHTIEDRNAAQEMGWHPSGPSCVATTEDFVRMFFFSTHCVLVNVGDLGDHMDTSPASWTSLVILFSWKAFTPCHF